MTALARHRAAVLGIAARYGATNVRVAGSALQDEEQPSGDLDLLVDMDPDRSLFDLVDLAQELTGLLGRRVEVITPASLNPRLRANVLADAQAL